METEESTIKCFQDLQRAFEGRSSTGGDPGVWLKLIRDKLFTMFQCPLKEEYNCEAFKWVANLCISSGDFSWLCPDDNWTKEQAKVFSLITRLSMNELNILLPRIQRHLTIGDEADCEDGKVMARSANSLDYDTFGNHLVVLESTIKSLVKGQDKDNEDEDVCNNLTANMSSHELKSLLERMKEIISEICDYLEDVHRYWSKLIDQLDTEKFLAAEGGLRVMSVWLSEEPFGFESQCERFLIDLILKNLLLPERPSQRDLLILALHSITTQSDKLNQEFRKNPLHREALQVYLDFVEREQTDERHSNKMFKLRCGLVKDLMTRS